MEQEDGKGGEKKKGKLKGGEEEDGSDLRPLWLQQVLQKNKSIINEHLNVRNPEDLFSNDSSKIVDEFCAKEMNQMSLNERNQVYEELHGCDVPIEETLELVNEKLHQFEMEIQGHIQRYYQNTATATATVTATGCPLSSNNISCLAYLEALEQNQRYITSIKFRLMFLRADSFDPAKAAMRVLRFCERKKELFGWHTLGRPLCWQDLSVDDVQALGAGYIQVLPRRDRAGRAVYCDFQNCFPPHYAQGINQVRAYVYMFLSALEGDEETQRRGFVFLLYHMGPLRNDHDPLLLMEGSKLNQWLPLKVAGIHMCMDHPSVGLLARIILVISSPEVRSRFRLHQGTHTECKYKLMTFGIPVETIPIDANGEVKMWSHIQWMSRRTVKEQVLLFGGPEPIIQQQQLQELSLAEFISHEPNNKTYNNDDWVELPRTNDIIAGKGKPIQSHPGNEYLRSCVEKLMDSYTKAKKGEKNKMVKQLLQDIRATGTRFLKRQEGNGTNNTDPNSDQGWWLPMSDDEARGKVRKTFTSAQAALKFKSVSAFLSSSLPSASKTAAISSSAREISTNTRNDHDYIGPLSKKLSLQEEKGCFDC